MNKIIYKIGTSGWNYASWRDVFYPKDVPQKNWLSYFAKHFDTLEINATFYRSFPTKTFKKWFDAVPKNFKYIIKVHRYITHQKLLKEVRKPIKKFCKPLKALGNKLGLILLQLAPRTPYDPERLREAIKYFDDPKKLCVEFRDEKWLTDEVLEMLSELGCIFCCADSPDIRLNSWVTGSIGYIRMHGRARWYNYEYTTKELKEIIKVSKQMAKKGAKTIYILFNNDWSAFAISNALELKTLLKK